MVAAATNSYNRTPPDVDAARAARPATAAAVSGARRRGVDLRTPLIAYACSAGLPDYPNQVMRVNAPDSDSDRMPANSRAPVGRDPGRYEIRVRGPIGPTMIQAFPTLSVSRTGQDTLLIGSLPDQSALYGVIHQLEALGLRLLEIRCPPGSDLGRPPGSPDPTNLNEPERK